MSDTHRFFFSSFPLLVLAAGAAHAGEAPGDCESLASRSVFQNTSIESAARQPADAGLNRPAFCEVKAIALPRYKGKGDPNAADSFTCK